MKKPNFAGFDHLVIFGDSLSDTGRLHRRTLGLYLPTTIFYKARFSNGPIWVDYVKGTLHWTVEDYAVGGAETGSNAFPESLVIPSLLDQVKSNLGHIEDLSTDKTLIAIWIGPNNYLAHGSSYQDEGGHPIESKLAEAVTQSVKDIEEAILILEKAGLKHFVIGTMPELGGINRNPRGAPKASDETLFRATKLHNDELLKTLAALKSRADQKTQFITYNANAINEQTYLKPAEFGFTRLDRPCFYGDLRGNFYEGEEFCSDPMGYKFWEFIHPNTRMQCYYAIQFLDDIQRGSLIEGYDFDQAFARCLAITAGQVKL